MEMSLMRMHKLMECLFKFRIYDFFSSILHSRKTLTLIFIVGLKNDPNLEFKRFFQKPTRASI